MQLGRHALVNGYVRMAVNQPHGFSSQTSTRFQMSNRTMEATPLATILSQLHRRQSKQESLSSLYHTHKLLNLGVLACLSTIHI